MNGLIFNWNFTKTDLAPEKIEYEFPKSKNRTVTTLRFGHSSDNKELLLLVSFCSGELRIFKEIDNKYSMIYIGMGHYPSPESKSENFGSLDKFAEIWSSAWCCNEISKLATVSEDQTCKVWEYNSKLNTMNEVF